MSFLLKALLLTISMCCFQDKLSSMNTPKKFVICSLLICIFWIKRLDTAYGSNCLFERWWNNNHLVLSTFRDNWFDINHVETFLSSTFILAKSAYVFVGQKKKLLSGNITSIKGFDALNRSFTKIRNRSGPSIDPCGTPQTISRQFLDTSWKNMYCLLLLR